MILVFKSVWLLIILQTKIIEDDINKKDQKQEEKKQLTSFLIFMDKMCFRDDHVHKMLILLLFYL